MDMAPNGSFTEAVSSLYDVLRWSETKEDAKLVLIADLFALTAGDPESADGSEHQEALYDRIYRATSGRLI